MLIVQKYGGSSVADAAKIERVAGIIADAYRAGNQVVVVLSAQGDTTDDLIEKAKEINAAPSKRELDMLLTVGEQISVALMAMQLEKMQLPAVSLTGWQIELNTNSSHGAARIKSISTERIRRELDKNRIVLIAGFQGVNKYGDVTTLGRGGSDTTAVAIAAVLGADKCQIFTDVDGVYTADPRKVPGAKKLDAITYDEMLELASLGSQVLHNRSVEMAKRYHVDLEVLSSYERKPGTKVKEVVKNVERMIISGVAKDTGIARITVVGVPDEPGVAFRVFSVMGKAKINVDIILQSAGKNGSNDISPGREAGGHRRRAHRRGQGRGEGQRGGRRAHERPRHGRENVRGPGRLPDQHPDDLLQRDKALRRHRPGRRRPRRPGGAREVFRGIRTYTKSHAPESAWLLLYPAYSCCAAIFRFQQRWHMAT